MKYQYFDRTRGLKSTDVLDALYRVCEQTVARPPEQPLPIWGKPTDYKLLDPIAGKDSRLVGMEVVLHQEGGLATPLRRHNLNETGRTFDLTDKGGTPLPPCDVFDDRILHLLIATGDANKVMFYDMTELVNEVRCDVFNLRCKQPSAGYVLNKRTGGPDYIAAMAEGEAALTKHFSPKVKLQRMPVDRDYNPAGSKFFLLLTGSYYTPIPEWTYDRAILDTVDQIVDTVASKSTQVKAKDLGLASEQLKANQEAFAKAARDQYEARKNDVYFQVRKGRLRTMNQDGSAGPDWVDTETPDGDYNFMWEKLPLNPNSGHAGNAIVGDDWGMRDLQEPTKPVTDGEILENQPE